MLSEFVELHIKSSCWGFMILMAVSVNASKLVVQTLLTLFSIIISAKHKYPKEGLCLVTFDSIKRFRAMQEL